MTLVEEVRKLISDALAVARPFPAILDVLSTEIATQVQESVAPSQVVSIDAVYIEHGAVRCRFRRREEVITKIERTAFYSTETQVGVVRPPSFAAIAALAALTAH